MPHLAAISTFYNSGRLYHYSIFYLSAGFSSALLPDLVLGFNEGFVDVTDNPGTWHLIGEPGGLIIL